MRHLPLLALLLLSGCASLAHLPVASAGGGGMSVEPGVDRMGSDFRDFDLAAANPELCRAACAKDQRCVAYTYVKPGVQGPSARCWLKSAVPAPQPADCCVSGVRG